MGGRGISNWLIVLKLIDYVDLVNGLSQPLERVHYYLKLSVNNTKQTAIHNQP